MPWTNFAHDLPPEEPGAPDDSGALLRLMQLVLAGVDASGSEGCRLTRDSAIVSVARALVGEATEWTAASRTATMALRDLVWRVDTARGLLLDKVGDRARKDVEALLDTADIHAFLKTALGTPRASEDGEEIARNG
ncbi:hypothetical protein [Pleomorphomonas sp. NRK KF1]|uniref:hypothetical protein n=1 Tax=Pleomorphomonas sp. NRK KF1 TaxID=2943000 RepID=UPI002043CBD4|nr:hypothetical protein [Pleomorphomonas sp. NRK KF1]MCM5552423.1 hypothetical protein [Pleomorphomonas sp. NRK KF1]